MVERFGVVAGGDEELTGGVVTDTMHREQWGRDLIEGCLDAPVKPWVLGRSR